MYDMRPLLKLDQNVMLMRLARHQSDEHHHFHILYCHVIQPHLFHQTVAICHTSKEKHVFTTRSFILCQIDVFEFEINTLDSVGISQIAEI